MSRRARLQNIMLASVTGGARNEAEYRQIREELFRLPGLKEALPRFVRTCGDLSQLWHFIKTQEKLGSYASRREYIWNSFRPLLAGVDDDAGIEREVFFVKGSDHDAYVHIRSILQTAKNDLFVIDPYMDGSIYQVLGTLTAAPMNVRILTSKHPADFALETKKFVKQHPGFAVESPRDPRLPRPIHFSRSDQMLSPGRVDQGCRQQSIYGCTAAGVEYRSVHSGSRHPGLGVGNTDLGANGRGMLGKRRKQVYIVGAGFSMYAGLPLQADFTDALLEPRGTTSHPMHPLITHLAKFVHDAFDHNLTAKAKHWPNLEDLFTNIDLAANTGHHLGAKHPPARLRMARRVLLARMMYMLNERYVEAEASKTDNWKKLDGFFKDLDIDHTAFISINWDTVIERRLAERRGLENFDYRCGEIAAKFRSKGNVIAERSLPDDATKIPVVKIHGSVNRLYCDNCRQLYWFSPDEAIRVTMQLITPEEASKLKLKKTEGCAK